MTFRVINNPNLRVQAGFTTAEFRKLDGLYLRASAAKKLMYRTVECDFDAEVASYTYYESEGRTSYLQFVIAKVGPRTMMYEVYKQGKGRIAKSGVFDRAFERVEKEILEMLAD